MTNAEIILKAGLADRELFAMARILQGERGNLHKVNDPRYPPYSLSEMRAARQATDWASKAYRLARIGDRDIEATADDILDAAKLMLADALQVRGPD